MKIIAMVQFDGGLTFDSAGLHIRRCRRAKVRYAQGKKKGGKTFLVLSGFDKNKPQWLLKCTTKNCLWALVSE
jgi:hypothetical protein